MHCVFIVLLVCCRRMLCGESCLAYGPLLTYQSGSVEQHRDVLERSCAATALAGLIAFASLTSDSTGLGKHSLRLYDPGR